MSLQIKDLPRQWRSPAAVIMAIATIAAATIGSVAWGAGQVRQIAAGEAQRTVQPVREDIAKQKQQLDDIQHQLDRIERKL